MPLANKCEYRDLTPTF